MVDEETFITKKTEESTTTTTMTVTTTAITQVMTLLGAKVRPLAQSSSKRII